jgi:hypothetical protein
VFGQAIVIPDCTGTSPACFLTSWYLSYNTTVDISFRAASGLPTGVVSTLLEWNNGTAQQWKGLCLYDSATISCAVPNGTFANAFDIKAAADESVTPESVSFSATSLVGYALPPLASVTVLSGSLPQSNIELALNLQSPYPKHHNLSLHNFPLFFFCEV